MSKPQFFELKNKVETIIDRDTGTYSIKSSGTESKK